MQKSPYEAFFGPPAKLINRTNRFKRAWDASETLENKADETREAEIYRLSRQPSPQNRRISRNWRCMSAFHFMNTQSGAKHTFICKRLDRLTDPKEKKP